MDKEKAIRIKELCIEIEKAKDQVDIFYEVYARQTLAPITVMVEINGMKYNGLSDEEKNKIMEVIASMRDNKLQSLEEELALL